MPVNQKNKLHLNIAISPLNSVNDGHIGAVLSLIDITRMQNLEMQAKRTGRLAAMGEMAARIAHEIRNPLGSIELFSTMLIDDLQEFEEQKALAEHISAGVRSINNIVSNLLLFMRPDQQLDEQVLDVHEALKDSLFFAGHLLDIFLQFSRGGHALSIARLLRHETDLVNHLTGGEGLDNLPTAGYVELALAIDRWRDLRGGCAVIAHHLFPKQLDDG